MNDTNRCYDGEDCPFCQDEEFNEGAEDLFHRLKAQRGKTYDEGVMVGKVMGTYEVLRAVNEVLWKLRRDTL